MQKIRLIALALAGLFLTSACAAGQIAATAEEQATLDGVNRTIGHIGLHGLSLAAPTKGPSYAAGSSIAIDMVLVNSGTTPDSLVSITSTAAKGWGTYSQGAANLVLNAPGARHEAGQPLGHHPGRLPGRVRAGQHDPAHPREHRPADLAGHDRQPGVPVQERRDDPGAGSGPPHRRRQGRHDGAARVRPVSAPVIVGRPALPSGHAQGADRIPLRVLRRRERQVVRALPQVR